MRLLDRLFGHLAYPLDVLVPSALWLAACAAICILVYRKRAALIAALLVAANLAGWGFGFGMRVLGDGAVEAWVGWLEAPFLVVRRFLNEALWQSVGVMSAPEPWMLFRGYSSWNGHWSVLLATLLNECAAIALGVLVIAAACRAARTRAARKAG